MMAKWEESPFIQLLLVLHFDGQGPRIHHFYKIGEWYYFNYFIMGIQLECKVKSILSRELNSGVKWMTHYLDQLIPKPNLLCFQNHTTRSKAQFWLETEDRHRSPSSKESSLNYYKIKSGEAIMRSLKWEGQSHHGFAISTKGPR